MNNLPKGSHSPSKQQNTLHNYFQIDNQSKQKEPEENVIDSTANNNTTTSYNNALSVEEPVEQNSNAIGFEQFSKYKLSFPQLPKSIQPNNNARPKDIEEQAKPTPPKCDEPKSQPYKKQITEWLMATAKKFKVIEEASTQKVKAEQKQYHQNMSDSSSNSSISNTSNRNINSKTEKKKSQGKAKLEQILQRQPFRILKANLLCKDQKLMIGRNHTRLLRQLRSVDNVMDFMRSSRRSRACFLNEIKANLFNHSRMQFTHTQLRQLLWLDESLFEVQWVYSEKIKKYDLQIKMPQIQSESDRVQMVRRRILDYLMVKQREWLQIRNQQKISSQWSNEFDINKYDIPMKELPLHPKTANNERIRSNQQETALNITAQKKEPSLKSEDVSMAIFCKGPKKDIKQMLYEAIRQKQAVNANKMQGQESSYVQKAIILEICTTIQQIFMAKNSFSMFRETLATLLNQRLRFKPKQIERAIKVMVEAKEIAYLKETTLNNSKPDQPIIIQINKTKFHDIMHEIQLLPA